MDFELPELDFEEIERKAQERVGQIDAETAIEAGDGDNDCGDACKI